ncbi:MAG: type II toxin-antitoxin system RelE/ParE family toxin [Flavobacteriales bacterium]
MASSSRKKYVVVMDRRAEKEIGESFIYYQKISLRLAQRYYKAIKQAAKDLESHPHYQLKYDDYRCHAVRGFPFLLHYKVDETHRIVRIGGVIHTSRNPDSAYLK